jgi:hypothetical protein
MTGTKNVPCRLCGGETAIAFKKLVLGRHDVAYHRCADCGSLQTDIPFWLQEAYAIPGVHIDVGCASRTVKNWLGLSTMLDRLSFPRDAVALDFGAASGLLARLMRDIGYNFQSHDKFAVPSFTTYHNIDSIKTTHPQLVTAFEVFEHLPSPRDELAEVLSLGAPLVAFTTWFCDGQTEDWIYLVPECGQHVFFYSEEAFRAFAGRHGYTLLTSSFFHVLYVPGAFTSEQIEALQGFCYDALGLARACTTDLVSGVIMGNSYIDKDFEQARDKFQAERRLQVETGH